MNVRMMDNSDDINLGELLEIGILVYPDLFRVVANVLFYI